MDFTFAQFGVIEDGHQFSSPHVGSIVQRIESNKDNYLPVFHTSHRPYITIYSQEEWWDEAAFRKQQIGVRRFSTSTRIQLFRITNQ